MMMIIESRSFAFLDALLVVLSLHIETPWKKKQNTQQQDQKVMRHTWPKKGDQVKFTWIKKDYDDQE
jgi:hypothetical protein